MSQQINLYEDRLRPRHELVTGRNLGVCALVVLVLMAALSTATQLEAKRKAEAAASIQTELTAAQAKLAELGKVLAERKISPALVSERDSIKAVLAQRQEIMAVLESGKLGTTTGFSPVMTGFARQTPADLWLTGFVVTMGGAEIEIRGRLFDPAKLPAYVQSLSGELVFQGRRFAALEMHDVEPEDQKANQLVVAKTVADNGVPPLLPVKLPRFVEFVLRSENGASTETARAGVKP
jgi:hypothetical protein